VFCIFLTIDGGGYFILASIAASTGASLVSGAPVKTSSGTDVLNGMSALDEV
jgi:hypothetical protein